MSSSNKYSPEVRERAVRMVLELQGDHDSQWSAIRSIAQKMAARARRCASGSGRANATRVDERV